MMKTCCMERSGSSSGYIPTMNPDIQKNIDSMKAMADCMIPHTFPKVPTFEEEQRILCLKQRILVVDGYELVICLSRAEYPKYMLETVQIQSQQVPFLPFNLVCKVGRFFMGDKVMSYLDFFRHNRKVYCWANKTLDGKELPPGKRSRKTSYEGFEFYLLHPGSVDLF